jgi:hypothetical protein
VDAAGDAVVEEAAVDAAEEAGGPWATKTFCASSE